ncbi:nitroreductase family protein [Nocardioides sp. HDW12B]|uniref:nitroreductase family protein n=1 Tax=Nocardioides sp. HDW12B TaxID=2714939 RepID=UPI0014092C37|nr:nitroreductase family protein [Nocardioides sp. HDW12B]QIK67740.1 nitroreductase family protein [Nocardioides sp. HDW12B]
MELSEAVRRRRMVRNYSSEPVEAAVVDRVLAAGHRAPSAGNSAGWAFLLLDNPDDVARYWRATAGDRVEAPDRWLRGLMTAPVLVVTLSCKDAYLERYAEPDKGWSDRDEARWPVPYWHTDTAMAAMLMLLTAVDEGLGACFFGLPGPAVDRFRAAFDVPTAYTPVGVVSLGHRTDDAGPAGSARRGRPPVADVTHRGRW